MNEATYKRLYPTGAGSPKFYGLPKVHKQGTPLRPTVSSIRAVTFQTSKELSRILKPLVGKSTYQYKQPRYLTPLHGGSEREMSDLREEDKNTEDRV